MTDQYAVAEVTRLVTNGQKNACSFLYGATARIAKDMGFDSIQTFILESEDGTSLKAAGWVEVESFGGGDWTRESKPNRRQDQPQERKRKFVKEFK